MTTSAIKLNVGSTKVWKDSGGDYAVTLQNLAFGVGRVGAVGDLGVWPRSPWLRWYIEASWVANPVANETLDFHVAGWDNDTGPANDWAGVGSADAALVGTQRQNMKFVGSVVVESAATTLFRGGGWFFWPFRYITPGFWNASAAKNLTNTSNIASLRLTAFHNEAQ